jgi:3'(2'),5'-bisphosphate nucleotidase
MQCPPAIVVSISLRLLHKYRSNFAQGLARFDGSCEDARSRAQYEPKAQPMEVPDHAVLVEGLVPPVLRAGAHLVACRTEGIAAEEKADGSPVSRADREAEAILLEALANVAPAIPVIAEEAVSAGLIPEFDDVAFLVDALDGTREFIAGGDDFTVNVALVERGVPIFGIVLAPASGRLFVTLSPHRCAAAHVPLHALGDASMPQLADIRTRPARPEGLHVLSSRSHRSAETDAFLSRLRVAGQERIGSSLKFGIIAAGEADVYPRMGPTSAWDIAAGHAVLAAAGGAVTRLDGTALEYLDKSRLVSPEPFLNPSFVAWGRPEMVLR